MLGLGESEAEVLQTMRDLRSIDVNFLTLGQYLRPSLHQLKVAELFQIPLIFFVMKVLRWVLNM